MNRPLIIAGIVLILLLGFLLLTGNLNIITSILSVVGAIIIGGVAYVILKRIDEPKNIERELENINKEQLLLEEQFKNEQLKIEEKNKQKEIELQKLYNEEQERLKEEKQKQQLQLQIEKEQKEKKIQEEKMNLENTYNKNLKKKIEIMNKYKSLLIDIDIKKLDVLIDILANKLFMNLKQYFAEYFSYGKPTKEAMENIKKIIDISNNGKILEVGSGKGFWSYLLNKFYNVDIIATDIGASHYEIKELSNSDLTWYPIEILNAKDAINKYSDRDILLTVWPLKYLNTIIENYNGEYIIIVGEPCNYSTDMLCEDMDNDIEHGDIGQHFISSDKYGWNLIDIIDLSGTFIGNSVEMMKIYKKK